MEMITLHYNTEDSISLHGIKYLLLKSGFSIGVNSGKKSKIEILYGEGLESSSKFTIRIKNKVLVEDIFKFPLFIDEKNNKICIDIDVFMICGKILSTGIERFFHGVEKKEKESKVSYPILERAGELFLNSIFFACKELKIPLPQKTFWPYGKKFAVCLTHDVDEVKKTYQWITYPLKLIRKHDFKGLYNQFSSFMQKIKGDEPYWTFDKIIEVENKLGVKSTFFFLNETGKVKLLDRNTWKHLGRRYRLNDPKVASIMKKLHQKGWDVGLHGSFYSYNDYKKIQEEKKVIENLLDHKVHGIRQHNLNLNIPETWLYQEKAGLEYDTTLGFNDRIGFRCGTCFPFRPFYTKENRALDIIEIPLIIEDTAFFRYQNPWEEFLKIVGEIERYGGMLTLLWHHSVFNKYEFPGWSETYEKIIKSCKKNNAWVTNAKQICKWWKWRENTDFDWEYEGTCLRIAPYPKKSIHFLNIYLPEEMSIKKILNAKVIESNKVLLTIQTNILKNNEYVEIEFEE